MALSVITSSHTELIARLILQFGVTTSKAYQLALTRKEAAVLQLEAWPFRNVSPRNLSGWMIHAIETNYQVPSSYRAHKREQQASDERRMAQDIINACALCDSAGFRYVKSKQYPDGAMRRCTHLPVTETTISRDAQIGPIRSGTPRDEERPAEDSANP